MMERVCKEMFLQCDAEEQYVCYEWTNIAAMEIVSGVQTFSAWFQIIEYPKQDTRLYN